MADRPKTINEIAALPHGGQFGFETREIDGKTVRVPFLDDVLMRAYSLDDTAPRGYIDRHGTEWRLGQHANGNYYRYPTGVIKVASLRD